jgi:hypothetical protein
MQKLQRSAGKLLKRTPDDAEVGQLLRQFDEADNQLKIVSFPSRESIAQPSLHIAPLLAY